MDRLQRDNGSDNNDFSDLGLFKGNGSQDRSS